MSTNLEESLRTALISANTGFEQADADLHHVVTAAAQALATVTDGKAKLTLAKWGEDEHRVSYSLRIAGAGGLNDSKELAKITVRAKGYPISIADSRGDMSYNDKPSLVSFFSNLATNPDSPLVTYAAFVIRKK